MHSDRPTFIGKLSPFCRGWTPQMPRAVPSEKSKGVDVVFLSPFGALGFATSFSLEYQIMGWKFIMKQLSWQVVQNSQFWEVVQTVINKSLLWLSESFQSLLWRSAVPWGPGSFSHLQAGWLLHAALLLSCLLAKGQVMDILKKPGVNSFLTDQNKAGMVMFCYEDLWECLQSCAVVAKKENKMHHRDRKYFMAKSNT